MAKQTKNKMVASSQAQPLIEANKVESSLITVVINAPDFKGEKLVTQAYYDVLKRKGFIVE